MTLHEAITNAVNTSKKHANIEVYILYIPTRKIYDFSFTNYQNCTDLHNAIAMYKNGKKNKSLITN